MQILDYFSRDSCSSLSSSLSLPLPEISRGFIGVEDKGVRRTSRRFVNGENYLKRRGESAEGRITVDYLAARVRRRGPTRRSFPQRQQSADPLSNTPLFLSLLLRVSHPLFSHAYIRHGINLHPR